MSPWFIASQALAARAQNHYSFQVLFMQALWASGRFFFAFDAAFA
jgi:hypothetical protein